jgi:chorismate-pyruvate lyase
VFAVESSTDDGAAYATSITEYFSTAEESVNVTVLSAELMATELTVLATPFCRTVNIEAVGKGLASSSES